MIPSTPQRAHRLHPSTQLRYLIGLAISIALILQPGWAEVSEVEIPYIGEPADLALSPQEELRLGREVVRALMAQGFVVEDPELTEYINRLGRDLGAHSGSADAAKLQFFVVRDGSINAFALPGGFIGVHAGLILASNNEAELAGVLAHEIAHVTQRHIARYVDRSRGWDIATAALLLAAIVAGGSDPDVAQAALGVGLSLSAQQQINHTRAHELEADRLGIRTLAQAGFDPTGMVSFFQKLEKKTRLYGEGVPELLRTHPVNSTRIAEAQARAAKMREAAEIAPESDDYAMIKARTRVLISDLSNDALTYYRDASRHDPSLPNRYGYALALTAANQHERSEDLLAALQATAPRDEHLILARARNQLAARNGDAAIATLIEAHARFPKSTPVTLALANAYLTEKKADQARQLLLESGLLLIDEPESYRLLAQAASAMNNIPEAHFQMAAFKRSRGDWRGALTQLETALQLAELSDQDRMRLQARLDEYLAEAPARLVRDHQRERRAVRARRHMDER